MIIYNICIFHDRIYSVNFSVKSFVPTTWQNFISVFLINVQDTIKKITIKEKWGSLVMSSISWVLPNCIFPFLEYYIKKSFRRRKSPKSNLFPSNLISIERKIFDFLHLNFNVIQYPIKFIIKVLSQIYYQPNKYSNIRGKNRFIVIRCEWQTKKIFLYQNQLGEVMRFVKRKSNRIKLFLILLALNINNRKQLILIKKFFPKIKKLEISSIFKYQL